MSYEREGSIPMAGLIALGADWISSLGKCLAIVRSVTFMLSFMASSINICMISKTRSRFSTTYHRLILAMCITDISYSLSGVAFNAMSPKDMSYLVWNAQGNQVSITS